MNVEKLKDLTTEQITELWKGNLQNISGTFLWFSNRGSCYSIF